MSIKFTTGVDGYSTGTIVHTLPPSRETAYIQRGVAEVYAAPRLPLDAAELNDNIPRVVTDPITGAKSLVSDVGIFSPDRKSLVGDPYLLQVTGTTANQYYTAVPMAALKLKPGDSITVEGTISANSGSANNKTVALGYGTYVGAAAAEFGSTSMTNSELSERVYMQIEIVSATVMLVNSSLTVPFGKGNNIKSITIDLSNPSDINWRFALASAADTISLLASRYSVSRA